MSNPYDPYTSGSQPSEPVNTPYGAPYGAPIPSGGGGGYPPSPYGPGGFGEMQAKTDAVSITAFVLSLTCVLSIVGFVLGIVGLGRTKDGKRKARWAAIAAIPIGVVGTILLGLVTWGIVYTVQNSITPDNAEVGQCVDLSEDNNTIGLTKKDCTDKHEAEIIAVDSVRNSPVDFKGSSPLDVCAPLIGDDYNSALQDASQDQPFNIRLVTEDPDNPAPDDKFICLAERSIGSFSSPLRG